MSQDEFDWEEHARDSIPFLIFVVLLSATMYLVAVL